MKFRKILPIFSMILLLSLTSIDSAFSTSATLTNNTPGTVDGSTDIRTVTFTTTELPAGEPITDVDITIDFQKTDGSCANPAPGFAFNNEIFFSLQSPVGTVVDLVQLGTYTGGAAGGQVVVTFDDSAMNFVGGTPTTGTFKPVQPLSAFNDELPLGLWTFTFQDSVGLDPLCFAQLDLMLFTLTINETPVGGTLLDIDTTSLILAGGQSTTWMIPVVLSVLGIALFTVSRKTE